MSVLDVVGVLIKAIVFAVVQFCIQPISHELREGFLENNPDVAHAAHVARLQPLANFCATLDFFRDPNFSSPL